MKLSDNAKKIAGAAVILCAASLMFGNVFAYVAGIMRVLSLILTVIVVTWLVVFVMGKMRGKGAKKRHTTSSAEGQGSSEVPDAESRIIDE